MRTWLRCSVWTVALAMLVSAPAFAQRIGGDPQPSAPCVNQPLKCIQSSPFPNLAIGGVERVYVVYTHDSGPQKGTASAGCGTAFYVPNVYQQPGNAFATFATARHVLEGFETDGSHYTATAVQLEFFFIPIATRACGTLTENDCHIFPSDCTTPVIRQAACWDWDPNCDIARILLPQNNVPAGTAPLGLGADPAVGQVCWIPSHPQGRCMEWDEGPVVQTPPGCTFNYTISTQGGSSGAPVLYQDIVVGVHVSANVDAANNPVCPNNGVYVSRLIAFLSTPPNLSYCSPTPTETNTWGHLKTLYR